MDRGLRPVEHPQRPRIEGRTHELQGHTHGEVRRRGREDVSAVERGADDRQPVLGALELVDPHDATQARRGGQQDAVVGAHEVVAAGRLHGHGPSLGADTRVDHGHMRADRQVRRRGPQQQGRVTDPVLVDVVADVHDGGIRGDAQDHGTHDARRRVAGAEVGEQRDQRREPGRTIRAAAGVVIVRVNVRAIDRMVRGIVRDPCPLTPPDPRAQPQPTLAATPPRRST